MSDSGSESDEEKPIIKKTKVHFGSLALAETVERIQELSRREAESQKLDNDDEEDGEKKDAVGDQEMEMIAKPAGDSNINVSNEFYDLEKMVDPQKDAMMAEFDKRKRARHLTLPTDDNQVRLMLRSLDQPICLFGEDKPDRRERLRAFLSDKTQEELQAILHKDEAMPEKPREEETTWYHEGPASLKEARIFLAKYSLPRAKRRLDKARQARQTPAQERALKLQETHKWMRDVSIYGSQIGGNRPVSFCQFSPDSKMIATASWNGLCNLWSIPQCQQLRTFRGHNAQADCIRFHPQAGTSMDSSLLNLASCGHDGSVFLWSLDSDEHLGKLDGHSPHRVSRLAFHPSGRFLATCCHDNSWRLFDLEADQEVLFQEGHSKAVFDVDFQCDGAVALTGGMDGYGRVWDLRTGRCIMFLEGHQNSLLSVCFAPNGYQMATGSADNTAKIWDLRMRRCIYTIPAHKSLISRLKYDTSGRDYLLTGSYDNTIKIWTNPGYQQLRMLQGHDSKVMCVDISPDGNWIASSGFDRTFKLWAPDVQI